MCTYCVDADKKEEFLKANPHCTGVFSAPIWSVDELKNELFEEWQLTKRNDFRIIGAAIKEVVLDPTLKVLNWMVKDPQSGINQAFNVRFV